MNVANVPPIFSRESNPHTELLERVAHDLRGPAAVTFGALDEIELALGPEAEKVRTYFSMARRGLDRVLRMADRLQRTAALEGGNIEWATVPTDLRRLTEQAVKDSELLEARQGVRVNVSSTDAACPVLADLAWVHTAIAEVVGSAIGFARSVVSVHTEVSGDEVTVTITDDGPGFAGPPARPLELPRAKHGVSLSLPLVCDVVAAHGGRIEIDGSRKGRENVSSGTRVILNFPLFTNSKT